MSSTASVIHGPWCLSAWILLLKMPVGQPVAIFVRGLGVIFQRPKNQWIGNSEKRKRQFYIVDYTSWTHYCLWLSHFGNNFTTQAKWVCIKCFYWLMQRSVISTSRAPCFERLNLYSAEFPLKVVNTAFVLLFIKNCLTSSAPSGFCPIPTILRTPSSLNLIMKCGSNVVLKSHFSKYLT